MDLGFADMIESVDVRTGINSEINELADLGVLKKGD